MELDEIRPRRFEDTEEELLRAEPLFDRDLDGPNGLRSHISEGLQRVREIAVVEAGRAKRLRVHGFQDTSSPDGGARRDPRRADRPEARVVVEA